MGDPSVVTGVDAEWPDPPAGQVPVGVEDAGCSGSDATMRRGTYPGQTRPPLVPGYCLVDRLSIYGGQAEAVNLPQRFLVPVPADLDPAVAPALILDWNTAHHLVEHAAGVRAGQRVFSIG